MALSTRFDAALPYFRFPEDFRAAILTPPVLGSEMLLWLFRDRLAHVVPGNEDVNRAAFVFFQPS
jgi:hypothetical protein